MDLEQLPLHRRRRPDRRRQDEPRARSPSASTRATAARAARGQSVPAALLPDMPRYALPTQLFFLFQRVDQLRGLAQPDLFAQPTCRDFLLEKDPLFARLTLSDDEYALYHQIYAPAAAGADAGPRDLPAGAGGHAARARAARAASTSSRRSDEYLRGSPRPTRASSTSMTSAAADRQQRAPELRRQPGAPSRC